MGNFTSEWLFTWIYEDNNNDLNSYVQIITDNLKKIENIFLQNKMDDDLQFLFIGFDSNFANQIENGIQNNFTRQIIFDEVPNQPNIRFILQNRGLKIINPMYLDDGKLEPLHRL